MALKRRLRDGSFVNVTFENKDETIKRLTSLVKELTDMLATVVGYDKPVAAASTYDCYK
jgi:hypothetical protein